MAGISWIKIETTLPRKPVVLTLRRLLKKSQNEVIGMLVRLLCWADGVTEDGTLRGLIVDDLDIVVDCEGFGAALLQAGWLTQDEELSFSEWDRHNGQGAKRRAEKARCEVMARACGKRGQSVDKNVHAQDTKSPQEDTECPRSVQLDKIRINKSANALSAGARACEDYVTSGENEPAVATPEPDPIGVAAAHLCKVYPKRTYLNATIKAAYRDCINDGITPEALLECLRLEQMSKAWEEEDGRYIPKLLVWLSERRFQPLLKQAQRIRPAVTMNKQALIEDLPEGI
jgi:hypothetical protein